LAEEGGFILTLIDVYLTRVRLALSQKDWEASWKYIRKAEQIARRCPTSIEIKHLQAWQARLQLARGNLTEAESWAETVEVEMKEAEITGPLYLIHEYILLTLARVWLAQGKADQAAALLERVRIGAEDAGRSGRALEAQMLQALAEQAAGKEEQAIHSLNKVLAWAEPEGYVRLFIEEGAPVAKTALQGDRMDNHRYSRVCGEIAGSLFPGTSRKVGSFGGDLTTRCADRTAQ
jgi:LuxR family maltose regulon positive regulatory protein